MIDLKRPKPKKSDDKNKLASPEPYYEEYPYNLEFSFEKYELEKLGLKASDFQIDEEGLMIIKIKVKTLGENRVGMCIRGVELKDKKPGKLSKYKDMSGAIGGVTGE